jgi:copper ion binding protein
MAAAGREITMSAETHTETFIVQGMHCEHCVRAVTDEVGRIPGVHRVDVDLPTGAVTVASGAPLDRAAVRTAVDEAGYELAGPA